MYSQLMYLYIHCRSCVILPQPGPLVRGYLISSLSCPSF